MNLKIRRTLISASFLLLIFLAIFSVRKMRTSAAAAAEKDQVVVHQPARKVNILVAKNTSNTIEKVVSGILVARDRYSVYTDVPGRMLPTQREFRRGTYFRKGSVIVQLDKETEEINLLARKNQLYNAIAGVIPDLKLDFAQASGLWEKYLNAFDEKMPVAELPQISDQKMRLFISARGIFQQYHQIKAEEARLGKFVLYAPISGILSEAVVMPGSYVQPGQRLGEIMGSHRFEVEMTLQPEDLKYAPVGKEVIISTEVDSTLHTGKITKINPVIDASTQSVTVIVEVAGKDLYHGMYVEGKLVTQQLEDCLAIDRNLLLPDGSLFIIQADTLAKKTVDVIGKANGQAFIQGVEVGTLILNETSPTFREGMEVTY